MEAKYLEAERPAPLTHDMRALSRAQPTRTAAWPREILAQNQSA